MCGSILQNVFLNAVFIGLIAAPSAAAAPQVIEPASFSAEQDAPRVTIGNTAPILTERVECISEAGRDVVRKRILEFRSRLGASPHQKVAGNDSPLYSIIPIGAVSNRDMMMVNFVDLDPSAAILDFECSANSYNGHKGVDMLIRSQAEQMIGVPVFAAADGIVTATHDGEPDQNTNCGNPSANFVVIDHGGERLGLYWHLKNGSVGVTPGQVVRAGQQLGLTGSSGCSDWPHLHFESWQDGQIYEPFAGPCRPGPSGWQNQETLDLTTYAMDFAPSRVVPYNWPASPFDPPRHRQVLLSQQLMYFWALIGNLPAGATWQVRFIRPNGTVAFTSAVEQFSTKRDWRVIPQYWSYNVISFYQIPGTWRIQLFINGALIADAPVDAVTALNPNQNAPPYSISAALEPGAPAAGEPLRCVVSAPLVLDDPDYDKVRYRYLWRVNGLVKRDVITGARADVLTAGLACSGAYVTCDVTPSDGQFESLTVIAALALAGPRSPDVNCDGTVNVNDLLHVINTWGPCPAPCAADIWPLSGGDGIVNVNDLLQVINNWG